MQLRAPWTLAKQGADAELEAVIYLCAESLRLCGILLQPYMPSKMKTLLDMLGVAEDARGFENAVYGADLTYGTPAVELGKGLEGVLFPPLTTEF